MENFSIINNIPDIMQETGCRMLKFTGTSKSNIESARKKYSNGEQASISNTTQNENIVSFPDFSVSIPDDNSYAYTGEKPIYVKNSVIDKYRELKNKIQNEEKNQIQNENATINSSVEAKEEPEEIEIPTIEEVAEKIIVTENSNDNNDNNDQVPTFNNENEDDNYGFAALEESRNNFIKNFLLRRDAETEKQLAEKELNETKIAITEEKEKYDQGKIENFNLREKVEKESRRIQEILAEKAKEELELLEPINKETAKINAEVAGEKRTLEILKGNVEAIQKENSTLLEIYKGFNNSNPNTSEELNNIEEDKNFNYTNVA